MSILFLDNNFSEFQFRRWANGMKHTHRSFVILLYDGDEECVCREWLVGRCTEIYYTLYIFCLFFSLVNNRQTHAHHPFETDTHLQGITPHALLYKYTIVLICTFPPCSLLLFELPFCILAASAKQLTVSHCRAVTSGMRIHPQGSSAGFFSEAINRFLAPFCTDLPSHYRLTLRRHPAFCFICLLYFTSFFRNLQWSVLQK